MWYFEKCIPYFSQSVVKKNQRPKPPTAANTKVEAPKTPKGKSPAPATNSNQKSRPTRSSLQETPAAVPRKSFFFIDNVYYLREETLSVNSTTLGGKLFVTANNNIWEMQESSLIFQPEERAGAMDQRSAKIHQISSLMVCKNPIIILMHPSCNLIMRIRYQFVL